MSTTTLRLRVLPRFPARISGTNGVKSVRDNADLIVKNDFSDMIRIPGVDNGDKTFFLSWNSDIDQYSILSFNDLFTAVQEFTGFMAAAVYDPQGKVADAFNRANHTGAQAISTVTGLQAALDNKDGKVVYAAKSAGYTALATDNNAVHRYTAAATVALTAAATLGANWHYTVVGDGGAVTIDPNGTETINGLLTLVVPNGTSATIICDGTGFYTVFRPAVWTPIGAPIDLAGLSLVTWTDLAAYRQLRLKFDCQGSTNSNVFLRVSTDNGSTFLSGASDYAKSDFLQQSATVQGTALAPGSSFVFGSALADANSQSYHIELSEFNKATGSLIKGDNNYISSTVFRTEFSRGYVSSIIARSALRMSISAGTWVSGLATLEGVRG